MDDASALAQRLATFSDLATVGAGRLRDCPWPVRERVIVKLLRRVRAPRILTSNPAHYGGLLRAAAASRRRARQAESAHAANAAEREYRSTFCALVKKEIQRMRGPEELEGALDGSPEAARRVLWFFVERAEAAPQRREDQAPPSPGSAAAAPAGPGSSGSRGEAPAPAQAPEPAPTPQRAPHSAAGPRTRQRRSPQPPPSARNPPSGAEGSSPAASPPPSTATSRGGGGAGTRGAPRSRRMPRRPWSGDEPQRSEAAGEPSFTAGTADSQRLAQENERLKARVRALEGQLDAQRDAYSAAVRRGKQGASQRRGTAAEAPPWAAVVGALDRRAALLAQCRAHQLQGHVQSLARLQQASEEVPVAAQRACSDAARSARDLAASTRDATAALAALDDDSPAVETAKGQVRLVAGRATAVAEEMEGMVERLHAQSAARSRAWGRSVVAPLGADEDDEVLGLTPRCGTPATRRQRAEDSSGGGGGGGGGGSDGEMPVVPARNVAASSLQGIGVHAPGEEVREGPAPSPQAWSRSMGRSARQSLAAAAQPSLAQWSASLQAACSGEGDEEGSVGAGAILASSLPALESLLRELGRALQSCVAGLARMAAGGAVASPGALRGEAERALSVACCLACHTGSLSLLCPTRAADAASAAVAVAAGEDEHPPLPPPPDLLAKPAVTARQLLMELPPFAREKERGSARIRAFTQELAATRRAAREVWQVRLQEREAARTALARAERAEAEAARRAQQRGEDVDRRVEQELVGPISALVEACRKWEASSRRVREAAQSRGAGAADRRREASARADEELAYLVGLFQAHLPVLEAWATGGSRAARE